MAVKPIGIQRSPIDATKKAVFEFYTSDGAVITGNLFEIWDTNDLTIVDDSTLNKTHLKYINDMGFDTPYYGFDNIYDPEVTDNVKNGGLENGKTYYYRFLTYSADMNTPYSDFLPILCLATPTFEITNPKNNEIIKSSSYSAVLKYMQKNNEPLNRVTFSLYDSFGDLIKESGTIYTNAGHKQNDGSYLIKYNIERLTDGTTYSIGASGVTVNGLVVEAEKVSFTTSYQKPTMYSEITLTNLCEQGVVQVDSKLISIDGSVYSLNKPYNNTNGNPSQSDIPNYSKNNEIVDIPFENRTIDLEDKCLMWDLAQQRFSIKNENFVMRMWLNPTRLCHLNSGMSYALCSFGVDQKNGFLVRWERVVENSEVKDLFSLSYLGGDTTVYKRSNKVDNLNNLSEVLVYIKKDGSNLDLQLVPTKTKNNTLDFANSDVQYDRTTTIYYETSSVDQDITDYDFVTETEDISNLLSVENYMIDEIYLYNAVFSHFNVSEDITITPDSAVPTDWDVNTIADCNFDTNINAGSVGKVTDIPMNGFIFKRRELGSINWIDLAKKEVDSVADFNFSFNDFLVPSNRDFEYALVPIYNNGSEGDYLIQSIHTDFNGVFVFDKNNHMRLMANVSYDSGTRNVSIGTLQPIGKKYPVVIQNGTINYLTGGVSGTIFNDGFYTNHQIDRFTIAKLSQSYSNFLVNGKSKILKDWNGNIWVVQIVGSPSMTYNQSTGNGIIDISFSWAEQGEWDNQRDLYNNGLVDIL